MNAVMNVIDQFAQLNVLVIGDAMLDSYLHGTTAKLCREAPVPVVTIAQRVDAPGGAANTVANLHGLGANVKFLSVIGDDAEGDLLRRALDERGIDTHHLLVRRNRRTLAKQRVIATSQMVVRFDQGSLEPVDRLTEELLLHHLAELFPRSDAVVVSDYGYGVLTRRVVKALADWQARTPRVLVVDAKDLAAYRHVGVTAVKPNYNETTRLLGLPDDIPVRSRVERMLPHGDRVLELTGAQIAAVTLDTEGALVFERGAPPYRTYAQPTSHARAAGAGDTFVSTLTLALAAGAHTPGAADLASAAAGVVVSKDGTSTCSADELRETVAGAGKYVADMTRLQTRLAMYREQGRRIVFTNGCFDILHRGHITYLSRAKSLGDVLIVGVNSDSSVRRLKGSLRPINSLEDRVQVLAALSCVDHLMAFDDDTPMRLIEAIRPDVFVKGGDYTRETLPEAPLVERLGGEVQILPYLQDRSTTGIIERIRTVYEEAAA